MLINSKESDITNLNSMDRAIISGLEGGPEKSRERINTLLPSKGAV